MDLSAALEQVLWEGKAASTFVQQLQPYGQQSSMRDAVGSFVHQQQGLQSFQIKRFLAGDHADAVCGIEVAGDLLSVVKVWSDQRSALAEIYSLQQLGSLGLKRMLFPEIWGLGRVHVEGKEYCMVGMTAVQGKSILEWLHAGDWEQALQACQAVGAGLAELHRSSRQALAVDKTAVYQELPEHVVRVQQWIASGDLSLDVDLSDYVNQLREAVDQESLHASYQHGDANVENFIYGPRGVAAIDTYHFVRSRDAQGHPCGWAAQDFIKFQNGLQQRGIMAGLTLTQVTELQTAFANAYDAPYPSQAERQLLEVDRALYVIPIVLQELNERGRSAGERERLHTLLKLELQELSP